MEAIITRDIIHKDIKIYQNVSDSEDPIVFDYHQLCHLIDDWKVILVEKYNAKAGQKMLMYGTYTASWCAMFFAAAELGLIFVVDWPHIAVFADGTSLRLDEDVKVDFCFNNHDQSAPPDSFDAKKLAEYWKLCRTMINDREVYDYTIQNHELARQAMATFNASPDSEFLLFTVNLFPLTGKNKQRQDIENEAIYASTTVKKVVNTHHFAYHQSKWAGSQLFKPGASMLHDKTPHHGNTMTVHLIPGFMYAEKHYFFNNTQMLLPHFVTKHQINHVMLMTTQILLEFLKDFEPATWPLRVRTFQLITPEVLQGVKEKNIEEIISVFSDTTIGQGFFMKKAYPNTDESTFHSHNMGKPRIDFWEIELRDGSLWAKSDLLGLPWSTSNDLFDIIDGDWYFRGRANRKRVNFIWINMQQINLKLTECFGAENATFVADEDLQRAYLAVYQENPEGEQKFLDWMQEMWGRRVLISHIVRGHSAGEINENDIINISRTALNIKV